MSKRKKAYVINLDYPPEKQSRLKRFVGARGYDSVRAFIVLAIENEITADLNQLDSVERAAFEKIINGKEQQV